MGNNQMLSKNGNNSYLGQQLTSNTIVFTKENLVEFGRGIVHNTLIEVGLKPHTLQSGKIFRTDMIIILGVRGYNKAVESGKLIVKKDGNRTSRVYAIRQDWERYLKIHLNQKI
jgi:hypothetical protein